MIVWLASYPRSGNTFLRIVLHRVFGLETLSLYNDTRGIQKDARTREVVGHRLLPEGWTPEEASAGSEAYYVKTHDLPRDDSRAVYVSRDGREVALSYWKYLQEIAGVQCTLTEVLFGAVPFGSWSQHVIAWAPWSRPSTLWLRFEDMVENPGEAIQRVAQFLGREAGAGALPSFEELRSMNPTFFRSGRRDSWREAFSREDTELFDLLHGDVQARLQDPSREPPAPEAAAAAVRQAHRALCRRMQDAAARHAEQLQLRALEFQELREQVVEARKTLRETEGRLLAGQNKWERQETFLARQKERHRAHVEGLKTQLEERSRELELLERRMQEIESSLSWKLAGPMRAAERLVRARGKGRGHVAD